MIFKANMKISSIQNTQYPPTTLQKKNKKKKTILTCSFWGGLGGFTLARMVFFDINKKTTTEENIKAKRALEDILNQPRFKEKNIKIIYPNSPEVKKIRMTKIVQSIEKGKNAGYIPIINKIIMPPDNKLSIAGFHEIGHAMNHNSKIGKIIPPSRLIQKFAPIPLIAIACFKKEKNDNKPKTTSFIKNNIGKLIFATRIIPMIDEALASIKGYNLASNYLNKELLKKVKNSYIAAFITYATVTLIYSIGAQVIVKGINNIKRGLKPAKEEEARNQNLAS